MALDWDEIAKDWESRPTTQAFTKFVFDQLLELTDLTDKRVLEVGCGTGLLAQHFSPLVKDIVALDSSEAMIEELDKKLLSNVEPVVDHLTRGLAAQHPAFRGQFDLIIAASVCEFIDDLEMTMAVAYSLLEQGGAMLVWDVQQSASGNGIETDRIVQSMQSAGFSQVSHQKAFTLMTDNGELEVALVIGKQA